MASEQHKHLFKSTERWSESQYHCLNPGMKGGSKIGGENGEK